MIQRCGRAQGTVEFLILMIILIGALIAMQSYIKRGLQGRWKASLDDVGDQYDPAAVNSFMNYSLIVQSNSVVRATPAIDPVTSLQGFITNRVDLTNSVETKQGYMTVAPP